MSIYQLYNLLPEIYHRRDENDELKDFLAAFQATLEEIHEDELALRSIQDIFTTPVKYLKYIARSLGWKLQSTGEEEKRNECATIIDFYDLKGTPYGIRLISKLTINKFFNRLMELYTPVGTSSSEITETPDADLADLLANGGDFVDDDWDPAEGGTGYHYDPLYSYIVFVRIDPDNYTYGEIRPRIAAFKNLIHALHPAGRYCYPYLVCRGTKKEHYQQVQFAYEEITGLKTYDDLGYLDDGGFLDENDAPLDESVSTKMYIDWGYLDTLNEDPTPAWHEFDTFGDDPTPDVGYWDDGLWSVHGTFEIS